MVTSRIRSFFIISTLLFFSAISFADDYTVPLRFDVFGDAVELPPLEFTYDLESSQGQKIQFGTLSFDPLQLKAYLAQTTKQIMFTFQWPDNVMYDGLLEMISRTGEVLWQVDVDRKALDTWTEQKKRIKSKNASRAQYGQFFPSLLESPFAQLSQTVRFCYTFKEAEGHTRICTSYYELERNSSSKKKSFKWLSAAMGMRPARVILNGKTADLTGNYVVEEGQTVSFFGETTSGASIDFVAKSKKMNYLEMTVLDKQPDQALITGEGVVPRAAFKRVNEKKESNFIQLIGFQQTIGDKREYWQAQFLIQDSALMVPGEGGGLFKQKFIINRLPSESLRPYLHKDTPTGTYVDGPTLFGRKKPSSKISSKQNSAKEDRGAAQKFEWDFGAQKRGTYNRSYVMITEGNDNFRAYHELYKGYPREFSLRLTTNLGAGALSFGGELAFNYWFEDIFGWTNYYLSRQRWGASVKAFRSFGNVEVSNLKEPLDNQTADLKYRFTPGLWGRDESWGLMFSYLKTKYGEFDTSMAGGGVFWARSMPKVFDDIFNWIPIFRYPKWVDFELVYYMQSLANDYKVTGTANNKGNWALNFHGKILWSESFFGEAGFGIKQFDYNKEFATGSVRKKNFDFTTFYGTFGVGLNF